MAPARHHQHYKVSLSSTDDEYAVSMATPEIKISSDECTPPPPPSYESCMRDDDVGGITLDDVIKRTASYCSSSDSFMSAYEEVSMDEIDSFHPCFTDVDNMMTSSSDEVSGFASLMAE